MVRGLLFEVVFGQLVFVQFRFYSFIGFQGGEGIGLGVVYYKGEAFGRQRSVLGGVVSYVYFYQGIVGSYRVGVFNFIDNFVGYQVGLSGLWYLVGCQGFFNLFVGFGLYLLFSVDVFVFYGVVQYFVYAYVQSYVFEAQIQVFVRDGESRVFLTGVRFRGELWEVEVGIQVRIFRVGRGRVKEVAGG